MLKHPYEKIQILDRELGKLKIWFSDGESKDIDVLMLCS
jgi:hypothetical protein